MNENENENEVGFFGESYDYQSKIKPPSLLGMSSSGNMGAITRNVNGLTSYLKVLVTGNGDALHNLGNSGVLGNKYFLKTKTKCINNVTSKQEDRYTYINNISSGNDMLSLGENDGKNMGLIPSTFNNITQLNPSSLYSSMTESSVPQCKQIKLDVIDTSGNCTAETHYVALYELEDMPNSWKTSTCNETFTNYNIKNGTYSNDMGTKMYMLAINILFLYILYKALFKKK